MKIGKTAYPLLLATALLASPAGALAKSFKRGVGENQFALDGQMSPLAPGVSWYYNWANTPAKGYQGSVIAFEGMDFVPMVWNANYSADNIREYVKSHPGVKYLLGFNEPNFKKQANMTPAEAAEKWGDVKALADELGLELVAPAMNYSPDAPYHDPLKWFDEFVALVGKDAFDYVAVHNYGGLGVMKTIAGNFHEKYGKPVWVTEFCLWPNEGNANSKVEPEVQIQSMVESVEWLEKTDWIYRYAWFKPIGGFELTDTYTGPCYGLIVNDRGAGVKQLSPQGYVYTYMSVFDPERWHAVDTLIPATEYSAQSNVNLSKGSNPSAPLPIEVSRFNAGAWLDYQIDVPKAGDYQLTLTVSGKGEPVRFDPVLKLDLVNADGSVTELAEPRQLTLPGNDEVYLDVTMPVKLPAGHQTLRLVDANPYQRSGIRISHLRISESSGVETIEAAEKGFSGAEYYSLQGVRLQEPVKGLVIVRDTSGYRKIIY